MIPGPYKESLSAAIALLIEVREQINEATFHVAVTGELKEWSDTMEEGDEIVMPKEVLEACADANVQLLVRLLTAVEKTCDSLVDINNLEDEVEWR